MLTPKEYKNRLIDKEIERLMKIYGAVCIEGPKWCGKTWTSMNHAMDAVFLGDPEGNFRNRQMAEMNPAFVLNGKKPQLIDEWQVVPGIWDAVRYMVDRTSEKGQYILTGSSTPIMKGELHGGSGRIGRVRMNTMSLFETGDSSGEVSLMDLFEGHNIMTMAGDIDLDELIRLILRGGWPCLQDLDLQDAQKISIDYLNNIPDDMERMDGKKREYKKVIALLRALGRAESNMMSKKSLMRDIEEYQEDRTEAVSMAYSTVNDYLDCFNRLFLIEDQPAFENKLRSSVKALKNPKRHFVDPSLAAAIIGATPQMLRDDLNTFGYLFEALCVHDLRIYAQCNNANIYHYSDEKGREADAIIQLSDGRWGMFEIKVGFNQVEHAASELISLKDTFEKETGSKPEFLCVICGMTNAAFKRPDGVYVVPITALRD